jgi:hypothetical protein
LLFSNYFLWTFIKLSFANDSNSLDKNFYSELFSYHRLTEVKKTWTATNKRQKRFLYLENAIEQLDSLDKSRQTSKTIWRYILNCLMWHWTLITLGETNILFLKLLEAQLISYHREQSYSFEFWFNQRLWQSQWFILSRVLAKNGKKRKVKFTNFAKVPYLNSSLFLNDLNPVCLYPNWKTMLLPLLFQL